MTRRSQRARELAAEERKHRELEMASDMLLASHGDIQHGRGRKIESGIYTDSQMIDKCRADYHPSDDLLSTVLQKDIDSMVESEIIELAHIANLTDIQMDIWVLHVHGVSNADIAEALYTGRDVNESYISRSIRYCRLKIARAAWRNPFHGWLWVYWQEVHRH